MVNLTVRRASTRMLLVGYRPWLPWFSRYGIEGIGGEKFAVESETTYRRMCKFLKDINWVLSVSLIMIILVELKYLGTYKFVSAE